MAVIEMFFSLYSNDIDSVSEVRAFIDQQPEAGLGTEMELFLSRRGRRQWHATFVIDASKSAEFFYRIGVVAQPETEWELRIHQRGVPRDLLVDRDQVARPKSWLGGTCSAAKGQCAGAMRQAPRWQPRSLPGPRPLEL